MNFLIIINTLGYTGRLKDTVHLLNTLGENGKAMGAGHSVGTRTL